MKSLYPLKFSPIYRDKIWGGNKIKTILNKNFQPLSSCGESWELSGVQDNISIVANGFLKDNNLEEITEVYMSDLVGEKVYRKFGNEFPLLLKFIDTKDISSIQVHPNNKIAKKKHKAYGKTEMWYIIDKDENSELIFGFNKEINKNTYRQHLENNKLNEILNFQKPEVGDVFFLPSGRIHAIGSGILLAEIQQTSDITYRIYDYDRKDDKGNKRKLHNDLAIDAIDFTYHKNSKTTYDKLKNQTSEIVNCDYFTTNILSFDTSIEKDYIDIDSFVAYMCIEGNFTIKYNEDQLLEIKKGETVLIPAELKHLELLPKLKSKLLEIYIK